jgi:hypothetical protein
MDTDRVHAALEGILETLASIEHERWSHWQRYMHSKGKLQPDGSMLIPADFTLRWAAQMTMPYSALTDTEKESDREQVRKYLVHIRDAMTALER